MTHPQSSPIIAHMSHTNGTQADTTTTERKPPTLADIVREKTDDGARIIDFFIDVMEGRIEGAELCHRIDAAKQLVKYGSEDAARFIARYRGVPCGHATRRRPGQDDTCSGVEGSPAAEPLNAPPPFTEDLLTVLSAVDEDLMARLVRFQTADGDTIIEFLDDVMQDRNEGFKCHHRIAAARELIAHIVRDEATEPVGAEPPPSVRPEPVEGAGPAVPAHTTVVPAEAGTHPAPNSTVVPAKAGTHPRPRQAGPEPVLSTVEGPAEGPASPNLAPNSTVVPAEPPSSVRAEPPSSVHPEPVEGPVERVEGSQLETNNSKPETLPVPRPQRRRTRTQRRREGAARAAILGNPRNSGRNNKEKQDKPAPVELTPAERRIKERLEQHWHEPDPYGAPIDSTTPGRSPPW